MDHRGMLDEFGNKIFCQLDEGLKSNRLLGMCWDIGYSQKVSNTHSCPRNGVTNWSCVPEKPKGYRGFHGRLWLRYADTMESDARDALFNARIHTGTGGYGSYNGPWSAVTDMYYSKFKGVMCKAPNINCYSWDFRFYIDDFEELQKWETLYLLTRDVDDIFLNNAMHKFLREEDKMKVFDQELLQQLQAVTR